MRNVDVDDTLEPGSDAWRREAGMPSLPEVHRSVLVPADAPFWRKLLAFAGPGFMVAVGYMDPGNWATDLAGTEKCDLIAMASHGHKLIGDLIHGSTIDQVRHNTHVPILVVRGVKK